jgi:anti-anti-sigma factor
MEGHALKISKINENGIITFALEGRLNTATAPQLQDALTHAFVEASQIHLDFSKLVYISSIGLRVLLMGQKTAIAKNAAMTISGVSEEIMEVLDMTGFSDILTIV